MANNGTHANEAIDQSASHDLKGNSRRAGDAPDEVQQKVIDIIIEEAKKCGLGNRDTAYYIAIVKRESGFNPDAANSNSTASGIAQVIDNTAKTFGIDQHNRFDARASIRAGLAYFIKLREKIKKDYGSSDGQYEPLVYYSYHYGEFYHYAKKFNPKSGKNERDPNSPKPLSELLSDTKYLESKAVVDEAAKFEVILNATHAARIRLTDITGKPMASRKVIAVRQEGVVPVPKSNGTLEVESSGTTTSLSPPRSINSSTQASQAAPMPLEVEVGPPIAGGSCTVLPIPTSVPVATELVTDDDGYLPEIVTHQREQFALLIPRLDYEEYLKALKDGHICESGNKHVLQAHGETASADAENESSKREERLANEPAAADSAASIPTKPAASVTTQSALPATKPEATAPAVANTSVGVKSSHDTKPNVATPTKAVAATRPKELTASDIYHALRDKGWDGGYATALVYMKAMWTRPKMPALPLNEATTTKVGKAPVQTINSSLSNKQVKQGGAVVAKVSTTPTAAAVKEVKVDGNAPWMAIAIGEQGKNVREKPGSQNESKDWIKQRTERKTAEEKIKELKQHIHAEQKKATKNRNDNSIAAWQLEVLKQEKLKNYADDKMLELEKQFNDENIINYLQSTSLNRDLARNDATAWCSSFVNWCVKQAGYAGTDNALAESWLDWGERLVEPKYGAITITTRSSNPVLYHVGFYTGVRDVSVKIGKEEVEIKTKGEIRKIYRDKYKKVKKVILISGNMSNSIIEYAGWAVDSSDDVKAHLVEYRWPTSKEKKV